MSLPPFGGWALVAHPPGMNGLDEGLGGRRIAGGGQFFLVPIMLSHKIYYFFVTRKGRRGGNEAKPGTFRLNPPAHR